jgi:hypothetical protein
MVPRSLLCVIALVSLSLATPSSAQAQDLKAWRDKLVQVLTVAGQTDEGTEGSRGDLFHGGTTYNTLTYPAVLDVTQPGDTGEGVVKYQFDARIRKKNYEAGQEVGTHDSNIHGVITAKYAFTLGGRVLLTDIKYESGNLHNAGNVIYQRIINSNGASVKP